MKQQSDLNDYPFEEEAYEDALLSIEESILPYDLIDLPNRNEASELADNQHPYADDLAYLEDIATLTEADDEKNPPASKRS